MTQAFKNLPLSPKQAVRRKTRLDSLLDPMFFKAIGESTRVKLLACLIKCGRPCSVTEIAECCSIDFSMVARHLTLLARSGVLDVRKEGRTVWYEARCEELSARFAEIAIAIDEWSDAAKSRRSADACCDDTCCGG